MLHHILIHFVSSNSPTTWNPIAIQSAWHWGLCAQEESVYLTKCWVSGALAIYNFPLSRSLRVLQGVYKGGAANGECNSVLPAL